MAVLSWPSRDRPLALFSSEAVMWAACRRSGWRLPLTPLPARLRCRRAPLPSLPASHADRRLQTRGVSVCEQRALAPQRAGAPPMAAYRPGQGLTSGTAEKLRARQRAAEKCEVCGERVEEAGLNCASVDDSRQWKGLLGEGTGARKKARCGECTRPLPEDHDPALGAFCAACAPRCAALLDAGRRREERVEPEAAPAEPEEEMQFGHLIRPGICGRCREERRRRGAEEARAKREEREQERELALEEGLLPSGRLELSLAERPFGMTASKAEGVGYLVAKVSDGKPAAKAGVRPGMRVAEVAGTSCGGLDMESVQALLKGAALPVPVAFEAVPENGDFCTRVLVWAQFSRKMRTRPPDKRRCAACVEAGGGE
ncbi:unnamed protein product [Prorocentrum cordatum]|uniref:PDZ domain-containing protein n=1 Tax=Prorocentrum cordatum TaxID=2364126 RepID=A0ABN9XZM7_9DINO|nr:unnamed protein product [Polarella glacialis]